ncbi:hypothetical protein NQ176_g1029 [Zarea fungicola]|uniref:Uncharacterized protein n=1 Tax=Zarea fungicola TaxID=93591 RepID=A0ACC1NUI9_9HYPO|nr:hypothetical protein NQ176_g1029 [Lecanicillium fungicola]
MMKLTALLFAALTFASSIPLHNRATNGLSFDVSPRVEEDSHGSTVASQTFGTNTMVQKGATGSYKNGKRHSDAYQEGKRCRQPFGSGWVVTAGKLLCAEIQGAADKLPTTAQDQIALARAFASSVTRAADNAGFTAFASGGTWTWSAYRVQNYSYRDIPASILVNMARDAIQASTSWITWDNYLTWEIWDEPKKVLLFAFKIFPTANPPNEGWHSRDVEEL